MDFFGTFRLQDTFQERTAPKSIGIDMDEISSFKRRFQRSRS